MAQITAVPVPTLAPRQIDLTSLLSAGLSIISSVFTDPNGSRTTLRTTVSSSTSSSSATPTSDDATSTTDSSTAPTSSSSRSRTTSSPTSTSASNASAASSTASPTVSGKHNNTLAIILGTVLGVVCLLLLLLIICLCLRRRRKHGSFFRRTRSSPDLHSDGESTLGAAPVVMEKKDTSTTSSEPLSSPEAHHASVAAPLAAAGITRYNDRDASHYPPIPAAHQLSSLGNRRSGDFAYVPDDPFADNRRGQLPPGQMASGQMTPGRERRSRHSLTLDPVREYPTRERSLSETRHAPTRRWTAGSGTYRAPSPSGSHSSQTRTIPRKPVGNVGSPSPTSSGHHSDWPFEHRRANARGAETGDLRYRSGSDSDSRYPRRHGPGNPNRRFYSASNSSF